MSFKRKCNLPAMGLQLRVVGAILSLGVVSLLLQYQLALNGMSDLVSQSEGVPADFATRACDMLLTQLLIAMGTTVPLIIVVGILATFRIAGPVYRFDQHLTAIADGAKPTPCKIRDRDELQGLCTTINAAVAKLSEGQAGSDQTDAEVENATAEASE